MPTKNLGDGELAVLQALWDLGGGTVRDVQASPRRHGRRLAYNTVQTVLARLVEKGLVACDRTSSAHRFEATVDRDRFRRDRLREIVSKVYDGRAGTMAFQLVEDGGLEPGEIEQLQAMLQDLAARGPHRRTRRSR
jgi:predicted transcriptional regulator